MSVARKLVGPEASVRKYDLLTALAVAGLAGAPVYATSMTRLIALITARYNWRLDEVSIGQEELARLWSVDTRTVKREIKRLRDHGLLRIKRPGVRGRVATYALEHHALDKLAGEVAGKVGSDYVERAGGKGAEPPPPETDPDVIPFAAHLHHRGQQDEVSEWSRARALLAAEDPARHKAWFACLAREGVAGGELILRAPSQFHASYIETHLIDALLAALRHVAPELARVRIVAGA